MKKIFLLSLLSVLFLSAFPQISNTSPEVLAKINITRSVNELDEEPPVVLAPWWPSWWFLYKEVSTEMIPGGAIVRCTGYGWHWCRMRLKDIISADLSGVDVEAAEAVYEKMLEESENQAATGEYRGSITKKIAYPDPGRNGQESYLLFQMKWDYDHKNPYNGNAEITITKTNKLGF